MVGSLGNGGVMDTQDREMLEKLTARVSRLEREVGDMVKNKQDLLAAHAQLFERCLNLNSALEESRAERAHMILSPEDEAFVIGLGDALLLTKEEEAVDSKRLLSIIRKLVPSES
jgi:hypothetical protein